MNADELLWKELRLRDVRAIEELTVEDALDLVKRYAVWIPIDVYRKSPWIAPYARRCTRIREDERVGGEERDMWGFPDKRGYFTDDNSLIKQIHKGKRVLPAGGPYGEMKLSSGMICCHVWAGTTKNPLLFSFVPNLVWLPKSLAPLSDNHESDAPHPAHEYLKGISVSRFSTELVEVGTPRVARAWSELGYEQVVPIPELVNELSDANKLVKLSTGRVLRLIKFLEAALYGSKPPTRFSKRYHAGIGRGIDLSFPPMTHAVPEGAILELLQEMKACLQ